MKETIKNYVIIIRWLRWLTVLWWNRILPERLNVPPRIFASASSTCWPSVPPRRDNSDNSATGCTYNIYWLFSVTTSLLMRYSVFLFFIWPYSSSRPHIINRSTRRSHIMETPTQINILHYLHLKLKRKKTRTCIWCTVLLLLKIYHHDQKKLTWKCARLTTWEEVSFFLSHSVSCYSNDGFKKINKKQKRILIG